MRDEKQQLLENEHLKREIVWNLISVIHHGQSALMGELLKENLNLLRQVDREYLLKTCIAWDQPACLALLLDHIPTLYDYCDAETEDNIAHLIIRHYCRGFDKVISFMTEQFSANVYQWAKLWQQPNLKGYTPPQLACSLSPEIALLTERLREKGVDSLQLMSFSQLLCSNAKVPAEHPVARNEPLISQYLNEKKKLEQSPPVFHHTTMKERYREGKSKSNRKNGM